MTDENALSTTDAAHGRGLIVPGAPAYLRNAVETIEGIEKLSQIMCKMGTMPKHLQGKPTDCFRIVTQAAKWGMDPFAVAECTSLVHGRLCYEGKLVAAALKATGAIKGRLEYEITGSGQNAKIVVRGTPSGGTKVEELQGSVKQWHTHQNGSNWDKDPESMLVYRGTRQWARRYAPDCLLGVYTPEEWQEEVIDVQAEVIPEPAPAKVRDVDPAPEEVADVTEDPEHTANALEVLESFKATYNAHNTKEAHAPLRDLLDRYGLERAQGIVSLDPEELHAFKGDLAGIALKLAEKSADKHADDTPDF